MKPARAQIERAIDGAKTGDVRLFLLHGPDESQSRELAARLGTAMGGDAERIDLTGAVLKGDPARLADEAAAISLFGGPRYIRIEPAGDEAFEGVSALLEAARAGNPAVLVAGALRKDSKLLKLALSDARVQVFASYLPEGGEAERLVTMMARELDLRMRGDVARRLASATGGDRALIARELEKLALYLDASSDTPAEVEHATLDALGAAIEEGDLSRLVDAALGGDGAAIDAELTSLACEGIEGVPVLRALLRRLAMLAPMRAEVAAGNSVDTVVNNARALFWKDKPAVTRQLSRWTPETIATATARLLAAERALKASGAAGAIAVDEEVVAIGRAAARMR